MLVVPFTLKEPLRNIVLDAMGAHKRPPKSMSAVSTALAAVFCASGTNIFGAFSEGMTGDFTVLLSKASMDIFASLIFAAVLGAAMLIIVIPQFLILAACFYASRFVMPLISEPMLADFIAVGGLMTLALGFAIAKIKDIRAVNMLPALILVFPVSYLFHLFLE